MRMSICAHACLCQQYVNFLTQIKLSFPGGGVKGGGGGGALDFHVDGGGVPLGVENLTMSQCARCTKKYTLSQYTLLKMFICIPCRNIAPSLVPDRGPVINIVGWKALGSNPVINGVARQQPIRPIQIPCANIDDRKRATRYPVLILMTARGPQDTLC